MLSVFVGKHIFALSVPYSCDCITLKPLRASFRAERVLFTRGTSSRANAVFPVARETPPPYPPPLSQGESSKVACMDLRIPLYEYRQL